MKLKDIFALKSKGSSGNRLAYLDAFHLFAAMIIWLTHLISIYMPGIFEDIKVFPLNVFFYGLTGKFGVAMLCVILGFLAYRKGARGSEGVVTYAIVRYAYFGIAALCYHLLAIAAGLSEFMNGCGNPVKFLLKISFTFNEIANGLFWSFLPLLAGSVLAFINGRLKAKIPEIVCEMVILLALGQLWVSVCLMGNLLVRLGVEDADESETSTGRAILNRILGKWYVLVVLFVLGVVCMKGEESELTWFLYGVSSLLFLLVVSRVGVLKRALSVRPLALLGRCYFTIFLLHPILYQAVAPILMQEVFVSLEYVLRFWVTFIVLTVAMFVLAWPLQYIMRVLTGMVRFCLDLVGAGMKRVFGSIKH